MTLGPSHSRFALVLCAVLAASCGDSASTATDLDEVTARWTINGDGTATDETTGLVWELKVDDPQCDEFFPPGDPRTIHCPLNQYTWSFANGDWTESGTVYTDFLTTLNTATPDLPCFAGTCDWRLPTLDELETLLVPPEECGLTCTTIPGPTVWGDLAVYWSSTSGPTNRPFSPNAWVVSFTSNLAGPPSGTAEKGMNAYARAVRGGSSD